MGSDADFSKLFVKPTPYSQTTKNLKSPQTHRHKTLNPNPQHSNPQSLPERNPILTTRVTKVRTIIAFYRCCAIIFTNFAGLSEAPALSCIAPARAFRAPSQRSGKHICNGQRSMEFLEVPGENCRGQFGSIS